MIELRQGNILDAKADALVNTVNCVGVMGRGIALQFKKAFPEVFRAYATACKRDALRPGMVLVYDLNRFDQPHYVINLPTKRHWRGKSRMEDIDSGLDALVDEVQRLRLRSLAVPPLGCGLGGLDWSEVLPRIRRAFASLPDVHVLVFEPKGAPSVEQMAKGERAPDMTQGRALLLELMRRYLLPAMDPDVSLLEIHKLMYFAQVAGQKLRLEFTKGPYGPYARNLRHVLNTIEGHFIVGFGDAADDPKKPITLKHDAAKTAEELLKGDVQLRERLDRVVKLIHGFETPSGMELLATVHWVVVQEGANSPDRAVEATHGWNNRKRGFKPHHIIRAWQALQQQGWLPVA